jgi:hypothetical protein
VEENKGDDEEGGAIITDNYNYPEFDYEEDDHPYHASVVDNTSFERGEQSPNTFEVIQEDLEEEKLERPIKD